MSKREEDILFVDDDQCWECGFVALVYWDIKYNGWRGSCFSCEINWPLS